MSGEGPNLKLDFIKLRTVQRRYKDGTPQRTKKGTGTLQFKI